MLPRLKELVINKNIDLGMKTFSLAMGEKRFLWTLSTDVPGRKMRKLVW